MSDMADAFVSIINSANRANAKQSGDYVQGGLLYCGKCHTPKQCHTTFCGHDMLVGCLCRCAKADYETEKQEKRQHDTLERVRKLRTTGISDADFRRNTFGVGKDTPTLLKCRKYVENWSSVREKNMGLLLCGGVGTGKTFAAACIANALIDQGIPVLMTSFPKILSCIEDRSGLIQDMKQYPLLILDDLGAERQSEYALETVYLTVDERYKSGKPMIVTTNLSLPEIKNPKNIDYARIYDRVLEMCVPLNFGTQDLREKHASEKRDLARELFADGK